MTLPVLHVISQVLFCVEHNCYDIIVVYEITNKLILPSLRFAEGHHLSYNTKLRVPPYLKINLVLEGLIKYNLKLIKYNFNLRNLVIGNVGKLYCTYYGFVKVCY